MDEKKSSNFYSDIEATVKFFDPDKGFGFVEVSDGSPDAYLPASAVEAAGFKTLSKGSVLFCEILPGQKNPEVAKVHFVDTATAKVQFLSAGQRPQTIAPEIPATPAANRYRTGRSRSRQVSGGRRGQSQQPTGPTRM